MLKKMGEKVQAGTQTHLSFPISQQDTALVVGERNVKKEITTRRRKKISISSSLYNFTSFLSLCMKTRPLGIDTGFHFMRQGVNLFNYGTDSSILL